MSRSSEPFLSGGGEMGARLRAFDWSSSPLGPPEGWSRSLKTTVRIMLTSRQPAWVGWGRELIYLYNDPYLGIIGGRHPSALGRPLLDVWSELRDVIGPMLEQAMRGDQGVYVESQLLIMERHGYREETYYTFSFSPVPDDDGSVGGILCVNTDDTPRVVNERQTELLKELAGTAAEAHTWQEACRLAAEALGGDRRDLPFAMIYAGASDAGELELLGTSGIEPGHPAAPGLLPLEGGPWPVAEALGGGRMVVVDDLEARFGASLPTGAWDEPPQRAALLPIPLAGAAGPRGVLIAGLNPLRPLGPVFGAFLSLVANQLAAVVSTALAYEIERERAEALEELDRAKTAFFSNVSHEFRTPLTLMLGPVEDMLERGASLSLDQGDLEQLDVIHRNSLRLLRLVNAMLDFSRIEAGRMQASFEPVDLAALTAELASNFRSACDRAGLRLIIDCPSLPHPVHVDRELWEKIVLNLLSNAFKFTLAGEIEVRLAAEGDRAVLTVKDTGVGIPPEELPRIFERFHRVNDSRGRTHEGTGIGLSLVQELADLHGGEVEAESTYDQGSCFRVAIPFGSAHLDPRRIAPGGGPVTTGSTATALVAEALRWLPGAGLEPGPDRRLDGPPLEAGARPAERARIVWADDNADLRDYVQRLLSERYDVEAVGDGEQALRAAREWPPDLVLSDVMMPHLDGFGLVAALRADPELAGVPIILLSARSGEDARTQGVAAGADDYLVKPFSARELMARVEAHLRMSRLRREADHAIRDSETRYRSIFTNSRAPIVVTDRRGVWTDVNPAMCALLGLERDQLIGSAHAELVPEASHHLLERVRARLDAGESWSGEIPFVRADGRRLELVWYVTPLVESGLRLSIATDVTEARLAEARLRQSEERYRTLVTVVTDVPWVCSPAGEFTARQLEWEEYTGQAWEDYRGFGWIDAIHPDDRGHVLAAWKRAVDTRTIYRTQGRIWRAASRAYRRFTVKAVPRYHPDQTVMEWVGACTDVEDRMRTEDVLRESEQRFRLMANTAPAMLWISEPDGTCSFLSRGWYEYTGQDESEGLGFGWLDAVHPDDAAAARATFVTANARREPFAMDYRLRSADGSYRWVISTGRPRIDAEGFRGYIGSVVDVHELKRAEASLREKTERLEEEDRRKDLFLATLGHELRNPLGALASAVQVHQRGGLGDDDFKRVLDRNVSQLTMLVNDLLEVSRITRGKVELKRAPSDLAGILEAAVQSTRPAFDAKEQQLLVHAEAPLHADVDPARIEQVVTNLLSNASKFTPPGGRIELTLRRAGEAEAVITVEDAGLGIHGSQLESVFDPFVQQDPGAGGLGIGLSLVRGLVTLHGGSVVAESPGPGEGSRFTVRLPLGEVEPAPAAPAPADEQAAPSVAGRVVVIDDSRDNADLLAMLLQARGIEARCAYTGLEGLELLRSWPPDVAIVDIGLPDLTGYEVARQIRAGKHGADILLLAVTGYGDDGAHRQALGAGFDARLLKPVDFGRLNSLLEERLGPVEG